MDSPFLSLSYCEEAANILKVQQAHEETACVPQPILDVMEHQNGYNLLGMEYDLNVGTNVR